MGSQQLGRFVTLIVALLLLFASHKKIDVYAFPQLPTTSAARSYALCHDVATATASSRSRSKTAVSYAASNTRMRYHDHVAATSRSRSTSTIRSRSATAATAATIRRISNTRLRMVFDLPALEVEQSKISTQQMIDQILDESLRYSARRPIMRQFDPASKSIWRQWKGTVVAETWKSALKHAIWSVMMYCLFQRYPKVSSSFDGFHRIWGELLAVTTFTLTFFVNEAYSCWRNCLNICYTLQGRLNDFSLALAGCAKRAEPPVISDPNAVETTSKFTPAARKILMIISRYIRLFNILSYASFTRSHRPLLTPQGMRRMVARGLLTEKEHQILINSRVAATSRHNEVIMWIFRTAIDARKAGHFDGGFGFEQNILLRVQEIRAQGNYMECVLRGRMPFGYAHIVQVLVDVVSWLYPIMAYSSGLPFHLGVVGVMVLTMTYQGLFDLAKRFLDPFHNENFWNGHDPIQVDTLIAETNAGSRRWMFGLEDMPIPLNIIEEGGSDLDFFVLPDEGFTTEEAAQREAEKAEKISAASTSYQVVLVDEDMSDEEQQQAFQEEFEETQAILSAPPGYDFVPGLDDVGDVDDEEECSSFSNASNSTDALSPCIEEDEDEEYQIPSKELFDQYVETAAEEYEEVKRREEIKQDS